MIMRDKYACYRDHSNPNWDWEYGPNVDTSVWTSWDMCLASVAQLIDDYTNKSNGQLIWFDSSDKVDWDIRSSFSGHDAAMDSDDKQLDKGESRYAVPVFDESDPPLLSDWIESLTDDNASGYVGRKREALHDGYEIMDARDDADERRRLVREQLLSGGLF